MSRQDRQPARTVGGLEQRYGFGKTFAELIGEQEETRKKVEEQEKITNAELSLRIKYDASSPEETSKIISMINAAADIIKLKSNRLEIESEYFSLSADGTITAKKGVLDGLEAKNCTIDNTCEVKGKLTATEGTIGGWVVGYDSEFSACVLRSANAVYSTVSYSDGTYNTVTGYVFTVLENTGLAYVVKESLDYKSATLAKISAFHSPTFTIASSGGGIL